MKLLTTLHKQLLGKSGENLASTYLQKQGYQIIDRNFKARYGELDIVCIKDDMLVFVEVKTRMGDEFGLPEEAVTPRKLREVIKTSQYYVAIKSGLPEALRIDIIAIGLDTDNRVTYFNHIENVTS